MSCLEKYEIHLNILLKDDNILYRFKCLSWYDALGCFCIPNEVNNEETCHVDIIRRKLKQMNLKVPERHCVKVKYLRKNNCDNLEEWLNNPKNKLCTRRGRVFIGPKNNQKIFHYSQSEWANPFK